MTAQQKYDHWLDIAQYDLETAKTMLSSGRWLYVVFMCQQAVEKLSKGLYTLYVDDNIPRVHNIKTIVDYFENKLSVSIPEEIKDFFDVLSAYYLNNRYPDFMNKLSAQIKENEATKILSKTEEVFSWLLTLKP
ncbi:MAG: HEPN domain-containing protein [Defluviitaleaceae bacterium]|nr:HEPN domain-containing protein [Defluviitaleaceae bacterium]